MKPPNISRAAHCAEDDCPSNGHQLLGEHPERFGKHIDRSWCDVARSRRGRCVISAIHQQFRVDQGQFTVRADDRNPHRFGLRGGGTGSGHDGAP
jgi:hypothetical protein